MDERIVRTASLLIALLLASALGAQPVLKRIEVERTYWGAAGSRGGGAVEAGKVVLEPNVRAFPLGWSYDWGRGNHSRCNAMLKIEESGSVSIVADWDTNGFPVAREHFVDLAAGVQSTFARPDCAPEGKCHAALNVVMTSTELVVPIKASVTFGEDGGKIEIRLVYEEVK